MQIRRMETGDVEEAAKIEAAIFSMPWSKEAFLDAIKADYTLFLVAEQEGKVAGYIGLYLAADEAEITNVAVAKEYRRGHVGEALVTKAISLAQQRGAVSIFLEVRCSNAAAIALYEKMGFSNCGVRKGFYERPKEDAHVMVLTPDITTVQTID